MDVNSCTTSPPTPLQRGALVIRVSLFVFQISNFLYLFFIKYWNEVFNKTINNRPPSKEDKRWMLTRTTSPPTPLQRGALV